MFRPKLQPLNFL